MYERGMLMMTKMMWPDHRLTDLFKKYAGP